MPFRHNRPMVYLWLENGDDGHLEWAAVDSGAHSTLLPMTWAEKLGIKKTLKRDGKTTAAGGHQIKTWSCGRALTGRLVFRDEKRFWGPELSLHPSFADIEDSILGLDDFFPHFVVTIQARDTSGTLRLAPRIV